MKIVYTIGYQQLTLQNLSGLVMGLDVILIDCRGRPVTRKPGFGGVQLARHFGTARFEAWGHQGLAGLFHGGRAADWPRAVARLLELRRRPMLMCMEHAPGDCHRHRLALHAANDHGAIAIHLCGDEAIDAVELQRSIDDDDDYHFDAWASVPDLLRIERAWSVRRPRASQPR